jgi:flagellar motor protein MotB
MNTSDHPVFAASLQELPTDSSWELRSDIFDEQWADEESMDYEGVEWEGPYLDVNEASDAAESGLGAEEAAEWEEVEGPGYAEDYVLDVNEASDAAESGWGAEEAAEWEEVEGPGYAEDYEESDWPQEVDGEVKQCRTNPVVIADYPRYATNVTDLRPDQVACVKAFAKGIVGALLANHRVSIVVEGFADFDAKGRDFEQQVSIDRAISARTFIINEVHRMARATGLPSAALARFSAQSAAFGSRRPSMRYPRNEDQRRQNRRIHIRWESTPLPTQRVPSFKQALDRAERSLGHVQRPGPKRRLTCLVAKLRDSRAADGYFSYDALKAFPGSAGWPAMSRDQFDLMVKATTIHARPQIQSIAAAARNESEMATHLEALDDNIGRNIFNFEQQLVGDSTTGVLMRTFNATIGRLQLDPNSILSCYSGYARVRHDQ